MATPSPAAVTLVMFAILRQRFARRILGTLIFESVAVSAAFFVLFQARGWLAGGVGSHLWGGAYALVCTALVQFVFWTLRLYSRDAVYFGRHLVSGLVGAAAVLGIALLPVTLLFAKTGEPALQLGPNSHIAMLAAFLIPVALERLIVQRYCNRLSHLGSVLVVGSDSCVGRVVRAARRVDQRVVRMKGILTDAVPVGQHLGGAPVIGGLGSVSTQLEQQKIDTLLIGLPYDDPDLPFDALLDGRLQGCQVMDAGTFYEAVTSKVLLERIRPDGPVTPERSVVGRTRWTLKDWSDRLLALTAIVLLSPVLAAIALAIKLRVGGSVLRKEEFVGKAGQLFIARRFRAAAVGEAGATTRLGRFLERSGLDRLPWLFSVVIGDLALVGPRPETAEFTARLSEQVPHYGLRHAVRPGLTGWAQVRFPFAANLEDNREKLRHDLYYVKNMSPAFDAMILLASLRAAFRGNHHTV